MAFLDLFLGRLVAVALPGGATMYLMRGQVVSATVSYDVGPVHYSGTVTQDAAGVITVNVQGH